MADFLYNLLVVEFVIDAGLLAHVLEEPVEELADPEAGVHPLHGVVVQQPDKQPSISGSNRDIYCSNAALDEQ